MTVETLETFLFLNQERRNVFFNITEYSWRFTFDVDVYGGKTKDDLLRRKFKYQLSPSYCTDYYDLHGPHSNIYIYIYYLYLYSRTFPCFPPGPTRKTTKWQILFFFFVFFPSLSNVFISGCWRYQNLGNRKLLMVCREEKANGGDDKSTCFGFWVSQFFIFILFLIMHVICLLKLKLLILCKII